MSLLPSPCAYCHLSSIYYRGVRITNDQQGMSDSIIDSAHNQGSGHCPPGKVVRSLCETVPGNSLTGCTLVTGQQPLQHTTCMSQCKMVCWQDGIERMYVKPDSQDNSTHRACHT